MIRRVPQARCSRDREESSRTRTWPFYSHRRAGGDDLGNEPTAKTCGFLRSSEPSSMIRNQQVSGSSPLAGSNRINNLQSLAGSAIVAVSALCRQMPRTGPQEPAPRSNIVHGCDGRPIGPPWPRAVNNSSSIAVRCRRAAAVAGKVSGLRGRCARPSRHRGSGFARPIAVQLAADPRSEAMTLGLIVARIPDAGLADAPDDALDAALGLPRRAVGAPVPSIASMARGWRRAGS